LELVTRLACSVGCLALAVVAVAGCSWYEPSVPSELADGTPARSPPVALEGVDGPIVASRARVLKPGSLKPDSQIGRCVLPAADPDTVVVERVGVSGANVTFSASRGRELRGCDASEAREGGGTWCGHAFARLRNGRLRDPRLSLTCRDADGDPLGFVWIQPTPEAGYVVVARPGYSEAHTVVAGLPVRVTGEDVDLDRASAALAVSEHARDGRRVRSYELEARVSG
jgi:hypothetical protein